MKKPKVIPFVLCIALFLSSCNGNKSGNSETSNVDTSASASTPAPDTASASSTSNASSGASAMATIQSASGSGLSGTAKFAQNGDKVKLTIELTNATPGPHAVHLHQNGDCSSADAKSAGGHWNPTKQDHGKRGETPHHQGDLPNVEVGQDGKGKLELDVDGWVIGGTDTTKNVINKAIIVHAKADDYKSQPAGNAGDRVGCGVVTLQ